MLSHQQTRLLQLLFLASSSSLPQCKGSAAKPSTSSSWDHSSIIHKSPCTRLLILIHAGSFTLNSTFPFPHVPARDQPPLLTELMGEQKRDLIKSGAPKG